MIDLNRYDISEYDYRKTIKELNDELKKLNNKVNCLYEENNHILEKNKKLEKEKNDILNSKSWKITKPLRMLTEHISKNKNEIEQIESNNTVENNFDLESDYKKFKSYTSVYQDNIDFSKYKTDIKVLTFYLPQYHTFKENDEWWGKGFTEWTNLKKSLPRFNNHYQPRIPHSDFGYYTLDNIETIEKQINLAKQHGIYGFCFYYYWFSGKRLMEKPLDLFINSDINFPFCLCWANENWTRAWDGQKKDVLIKQDYSDDDYEKFIIDLKKYLIDKRYIKIENKPVIMVYNPKEIPDFKTTVQKWRFYAKKHGIGEIYIMSKCDLADESYKNTEFIDAEFDFPPQGIGRDETHVTGLDSKKIFNYKKVVDDMEYLYKKHYTLKPFYYSCTMGWDNSPRRKEDYTIYYNYSLESFYRWVKLIVNETRKRNKKENRFMFVNAWNEWCEGTYLEPDEKYGYSNINTLSKAIFDLPFDN